MIHPTISDAKWLVEHFHLKGATIIFVDQDKRIGFTGFGSNKKNCQAMVRLTKLIEDNALLYITQGDFK